MAMQRETFGVMTGLAFKVRANRVELPLLVATLRGVLENAIQNSPQMKEFGVVIEAGMTGVDDFKAAKLEGNETFRGSVIPHGSFKRDGDGDKKGVGSKPVPEGGLE